MTQTVKVAASSFLPRAVFELVQYSQGRTAVSGVNLSPSDFQEAVGELVEGQAPHPAAMLKLLHLLRVQSHRT